jgi:radical SAM superfamily enzyme with C-terminal helix-hairpin-helix motif
MLMRTTMLCRAVALRQVDPFAGTPWLRELIYARKRRLRSIFRAWKKRYEHRLFDAMLMTGHASLQMSLDDLAEEASRMLGHESEGGSG